MNKERKPQLDKLLEEFEGAGRGRYTSCPEAYLNFARSPNIEPCTAIYKTVGWGRPPERIGHFYKDGTFYRAVPMGKPFEVVDGMVLAVQDTASGEWTYIAGRDTP